jgi:hypothetical protein
MFKCEHCGCSDRILEVHHLYYVRGHKAWQYPLKALKALCSRCHSKWHDNYEIVVLHKIRNKTKEFKPPSKLYKHKGPKYFKWLERKQKKVKKIPLVETQSTESKYKPRKKKLQGSC